MQIVFERPVPLLNAAHTERTRPKHWDVEKNHLWSAFQLNCHGLKEMKRLGGGSWGRGGVHRGFEGVFPFDLFRAEQKGGGAVSLSWQTHLAGNCSDHSDNQSWKCMDKQKFTAPIG